MKTALIISFALLSFSPHLIVGEKTVASDLKKHFKREPNKLENYRFAFIPQILINAVPVIKQIFGLWQIFHKEDKKEHEILQGIMRISDQVADLDYKISGMAETIIRTILEALPKILKLQTNLHDLQLIINQINFSHDQLRSYLIYGYKNNTSETGEMRYSEMTSANTSQLLRNGLDFGIIVEEMSKNGMKRDADSNWIIEKFTLLDFATWATGHGFNSLPSLTRRMNDMILPGFNGVGILELVKMVSEEIESNICGMQQSTQQTLYNLYNTIAIAEMKAETVIQFSYMILKMYNKGNFAVEAELARLNYKNAWKKKIDIARNVLSKANRSFYKCDPKEYVEGVTYTKLTKLLLGYIENEVNLNRHGTCKETCSHYQYTYYYGCFKHKFCAHQPRCRGRVLWCTFVDSDMKVCRSSDPERRYDWVKYKNGKTYGVKGSCSRRRLFKVDSWWRYLFWHCTYCLCYCDETTDDSDRYFNLRDVTSDIENNMVVTGVRIVKNNQIIHLQIQQGLLTPFGLINTTSLSWKPVDNYTVYDNNVANKVDYFMMYWSERAVDIDDVVGPAEHVVTGVRFRYLYAHMNLEVRVTPINFTSGTVFNANDSYWVSNPNTDWSKPNPRTRIWLNDPDIPTRNGPHSLNSRPDQFIVFQITSYRWDLGQTTVPFLDSQNLTSEGFPLSGIGLIHRGKAYSGGFIAPKLISYDFTPHLRYDENI